MNGILTYVLFGLITFLLGKVYGRYEYKMILRNMKPSESEKKELVKKIDEAFDAVIKEKKPKKSIALSEDLTKRFVAIDAAATKLKNQDEALTKKVEKLWEDVRKEYKLKKVQSLTVSDDYKSVKVIE